VGLLSEIRDGAVGTEVPVTVLLRQCAVLATRLQNDELREWAQLEQNGYPEGVELPPYRASFRPQVLGNFNGPFGSGAENMPLPESAVREEHREWLFTAELRQSVAELEELLDSGEKSFQMPWPGDAVVAYQDNFMEHMALMSARRMVPRSVFANALSGIRDRLVQFTLEIEQLNPDAGEAGPGETPIEPSQVTQIFNQAFYGETAFAAAGHTVHQQADLSKTTIQETLDAFGIDGSEQRALIEALEEEGVLDGKAPGEKTRCWVERLQQGAISVGTGVTTQTAVAAVVALLGLH
jgi:hypothetical protein